MKTQTKYETVEVLKSNLTGKLYETEKDLTKGDHEYILKEIENEFGYNEYLGEKVLTLHDIVNFSNKYGTETFMNIIKELC